MFWRLRLARVKGPRWTSRFGPSWLDDVFNDPIVRGRGCGKYRDIALAGL